MREPTRWALLWQERGEEAHQHIIFEDLMPALFLTRKAAREFADRKYGYIKTRKDLRRPPHEWRMPKPVRVKVVLA
jgi:hypothetical protein